jgi:uncharacterized pyridoxal phosphate-containing UPF0001 family protein
MTDVLAPPAVSLTDITLRYDAFMGSRVIRAFIANGGEVFIATERRPWAVIAALLDAGHRCFAEKHVQEVSHKWPDKALLPPGLALHYYGHLQTNKAKPCLDRFDAIESIDRERLAQVVTALLPHGQRAKKFYIQVNIGREPQKSGAMIEDVDDLLDAMSRLGGPPVSGLMAIPPRHDQPAKYFSHLRRLADRLALAECIMGMTDDYDIAIDCGATAIRIGRGILGPKPGARVNG